jgi:hypothetical protein
MYAYLRDAFDTWNHKSDSQDNEEHFPYDKQTLNSHATH